MSAEADTVTFEVCVSTPFGPNVVFETTDEREANEVWHERQQYQTARMFVRKIRNGVASSL